LEKLKDHTQKVKCGIFWGNPQKYRKFPTAFGAKKFAEKKLAFRL